MKTFIAIICIVYIMLGGLYFHYRSQRLENEKNATEHYNELERRLAELETKIEQCEIQLVQREMQLKRRKESADTTEIFIVE